MTEDTQAQSLLDAGYIEVQEVQEVGILQVGGRVRHIGQQYSEAYRSGTATIERIFQHPRRGDVEMIVRRDREEWGSMYGYWASYHTMTVDKS